MMNLPVSAARSVLPAVSLTPPRAGAGDAGQRYEIRYIAQHAASGGDAAQALGWTDDSQRADAVVALCRRRGDAAAWIRDRGTIGVFKNLQRRVEAGRGRDIDLDREFYWWFEAQPEGRAGEFEGRRRINFNGPRDGAPEWFRFDRFSPGFWSPTRSIGDARRLVRQVFPGWWINSGTSSLNDYAAIGPDYAGPARERLLRDFPHERFDRFHCALGSDGDESRECRALLSCLLQAWSALLQEGRKNG